MRKDHPQQLSLSISLNDDATFQNFHVAQGSANQQMLHALQQQLGPAGEQVIMLWGGTGVGLSHLLQAACIDAQSKGFEAQYLPLLELTSVAPEALLDDLDQLDLVCLDDLQAVVGHAGWEQALFGFFNRMRDSGRRLLISADASPVELPVILPDLKSRLAWGLTFHVQPLTDDDKRAALQLRAKQRGLELGDEVSQFILHRASRDLHQLFEILVKLDQASLAEQRRLTIPFVKQVLGL